MDVHGTKLAQRQLVQVYQIGERLVVGSYNQTTTGLWISGEFAVVCPASAAPAVIGAAVEQALAQGVIGVAVPDRAEVKNVGRYILDATGQKTWQGIQREARHVPVRRDGSGTIVTPTRNGGTASDDRGFHHLTGQAITLKRSASVEDVGMAVRTALQLCS